MENATENTSALDNFTNRMLSNRSKNVRLTPDLNERTSYLILISVVPMWLLYFFLGFKRVFF